MSALQCKRRLWLEVNAPDLALTSAATELAFAGGNQVGAMARDLATRQYGTGELIDIDGPDGWAEGLQRCRARLGEPGLKVLFEAPFAHGGLGVVCDIVVRHADDTICLAEVKSSTGIKGKPYVDDAAIQAWTMAQCGAAPDRVLIRVIDNSFVYRGDGDYRGLLRDEDVTDAVRERLPFVPTLLDESRAVAGEAEPAIRTGAHCTKPYACGFAAHCARWEEREFGAPAEFPVGLIGRRNTGRLTPQERVLIDESGWRDLRDLPAGFPEDERAQRVVEAARAGRPWVSPTLQLALDELPYPRYYFDFETIAHAVPVWADTRPYQQVPFQWSCHIERSGGQVEHHEFLDLSGGDPRGPCARAIVELIDESCGCVVVYNRSFEASRLNDLIKHLPRYAERLAQTLVHLRDLLPIMRNHYYHPMQMGSYSIKDVLPAVVPGLGYGDLDEVRSGGEAQSAYLEAVADSTNAERRQALESALRQYCKRDTEAMLALVRQLSHAGEDA